MPIIFVLLGRSRGGRLHLLHHHFDLRELLLLLCVQLIVLVGLFQGPQPGFQFGLSHLRALQLRTSIPDFCFLTVIAHVVADLVDGIQSKAESWCRMEGGGADKPTTKVRRLKRERYTVSIEIIRSIARATLCYVPRPGTGLYPYP